jgi:predicted NodU family carbamoyl transferase|tara:strand:- start:799 stop:1755 length:957 start_codon:yes stop_codon:yes gene_type:complete
MRKILGINISHNVSFAYFENDILKEYYEEDRFNKIKNFEPPHPFLKKDYEYKALKKFKDITFDTVVFVSYQRGDILIDKAYVDHILKQLKYRNIKFYYEEHHIFHAVCGFYFSKFKEALALICDGGGEIFKSTQELEFRALESIYYMNEKRIITFYKHYSNAKLKNKYSNFFDFFEINLTEKNIRDDNADIKISDQEIAGVKYLQYTREAGFDNWEEGQLMGIAAYKDKKTKLDKKVLNIAHKAQEETLEERIKLIEKAMTYSDCKNIILSGGYHLNCSNNFKLVKRFPKLNFFVDPIAYDGGTAVGGGYYYEKNFKN